MKCPKCNPTFENEIDMLRFYAKKYVPVHILDSAYIEMELNKR